MLWYSSQIICPTEGRDVFSELMGIEADAVVPHHDTVRGRSQDDDLNLESIEIISSPDHSFPVAPSLHLKNK